MENQFGPLSPARIFERNHVHSRFVQRFGEFVHSRHRSLRWLEGANPSIALDIESNMAGLDDMSRGKGSSANHKLHMLGDNFLVADAVLNRTNRAVPCKN